MIPILVIFRKEKEDAETKLESEKQERIELEEQICNLQVRWVSNSNKDLGVHKSEATKKTL